MTDDNVDLVDYFVVFWFLNYPVCCLVPSVDWSFTIRHDWNRRLQKFGTHLEIFQRSAVKILLNFADRLYFWRRIIWARRHLDCIRIDRGRAGQSLHFILLVINKFDCTQLRQTSTYFNETLYDCYDNKLISFSLIGYKISLVLHKLYTSEIQRCWINVLIFKRL